MLSVVFSTYNRAAMLSRTLDSLISQDFTQPWQLIVIDNNSSDNTMAILEKYQDRLPMQILFEPRAGKNFALNTALPYIKGEYVAFTDDDVRFESDWLSNIQTVIMQYPDYSIFSGKIIPEWEVTPQEWIIKWAPLGDLYAVTQDFKNGPCDPGKVWGPNMVVKADIFENIKFAEHIGPNGSDSYPMGSETEFTTRAANLGYQCFASNTFSVYHWIPAHSLKSEWIFKRATRSGMGVTLGNVKQKSVVMFLRLKTRYLIYKFLSILFPLIETKKGFWWKYKANYLYGCLRGLEKI